MKIEGPGGCQVLYRFTKYALPLQKYFRKSETETSGCEKPKQAVHKSRLAIFEQGCKLKGAKCSWRQECGAAEPYPAAVSHATRQTEGTFFSIQAVISGQVMIWDQANIVQTIGRRFDS